MADALPVPILTYHSLDDSGSVISVAPAAFREHVRTLRDGGFQGISLGDLLDVWAGRRACDRPVVLTFDDGFRSVLEHAAPAIQDVGFRATLFAVAGYGGRTNDWPGQPPEIPRLPLLSAGELTELAGQGFEIGSHGLNHADLGRASPSEAQDEIVVSKRRLEDDLGAEVGVFAYPYGSADDAARGLVRRTYRAACCVEMAVARPGDDLHWLRRIEVYYLREPRVFRLFGTAAGRAYLAVRALGRGLRKRIGQ